jgi:SAM-dependent methyltransferase
LPEEGAKWLHRHYVSPLPVVDFELAYRASPPWEIGKPQPVIVSLAASGLIVGAVLDVGCGTGENALELARNGIEVIGVDFSSTAIGLAQTKATVRGVDVDFRAVDANRLETLGRRFPTIVDSALLHIIGDLEEYAVQLDKVIEPGGTLIILEISEHAPNNFPRISEAQIRETFQPSVWAIESLEPTTYETQLGPIPAWLGRIRATGERVESRPGLE